MNHWNMLVFPVSFVFALTVRAEDIQTPLVLTWDYVVSCAEKNPGLLMSQSQVKAAEGGVSAARQYTPIPIYLFAGHAAKRSRVANPAW